MASLTRNRSVPTNVPNDINLEYYAQRAPSCGLIITEGTLISHQGYVTYPLSHLNNLSSFAPLLIPAFHVQSRMAKRTRNLDRRADCRMEEGS